MDAGATAQLKRNFAPEEGVDAAFGVPCFMRDGTRLAADVYTPRGDGPFPVLLMRQPYGRDIASTVVYAQPTWFCREGFIVVIQDVRGRGGSEGTFDAFQNEADDGFDTVEWAAKLPKANGRVGMYGFSYQGSTQLLAASRRPAALKAMAPHMTAFDLYSGWFYRDGMLQLATTLGWGNQMLREDARRKGADDLYNKLESTWSRPGSLLHELPVSRVKPLTDEEANPYVREWLEHEKKDAWWSAFDFLERVSEIAHVPCYHLSGWYDFYTRGSMDGYRAMAARSPSTQKLELGPWGHIPWGTTVGGRYLGAEACPRVNRTLCNWMKRWCLPEGEMVDTGPAVRYFSMGDEQWHEADKWPPAQSLQTRFYLGSKGNANSVFGDGFLQENPPAQTQPADRFVYDPEVPVTGPGGAGPGYTWGPVNLYPSQQGNNLLVYCSEKLATNVFYAGRPEALLQVRSSARRTAFVCRLSILREGESLFLSLGAASVDAADWRDDGTAAVRVLLDDIAFSLSPGDRLCLDVASSAFPLLARHPNAETPLNKVEQGDFRRALQVVLHDPDRPSFLELNKVA